MADDFAKCGDAAKKALADEGIEFNMSEADRVELGRLAKRKIYETKVENQGDIADLDFDKIAKVTREEFLTNKIIEKRNAAINLRARVEVIKYIQDVWPDNPIKGIEALLSGRFENRTKARFSVNIRQSVMFNRMFSNMESSFREAGVWVAFKKNVYEDDIPKARDILSGKTKDPGDIPAEAFTIARLMKTSLDDIRERANRAGAWIGDEDNYLIKASHDMWAIRKANNVLNGRQLPAITKRQIKTHQLAWIQFTKRLLSDETYTKAGIDPQNKRAVNDFLKAVNEGLASGIHNSNTASGDGMSIDSTAVGAGSIAKRMSHERVLFFKDNVNWKKYNDKFGKSDLPGSMQNAMESAAHSIGLMEVFGPNALGNYGALKEAAAKMTKGRASLPRGIGGERHLDNIFAELDGSVNIPDNASFAKFSSDFRMNTSMAKLGGATITALGDVPIMASTLNYDGVHLGQAYHDIIMESINSISDFGRRKEYMAMLESVADTALGSFGSRITPGAGTLSSSDMARLQSKFFAISGLSLWTDFQRLAATKMFSRGMAFNKDASFNELDPDFQRAMRTFGIEEQEWEVVRKAHQKADDGKEYTNAQSVNETELSAFEPMARDKVEKVIRRKAATVQKIQQRIKGIRERIAKTNTESVKSIEVGRDSLDKFIGNLDKRVGKRKSELQGSIDRVKNQFDEVTKANAELDAAIREERLIRDTTDLLERVEEGADVDTRVSDIAKRRISRFGGTQRRLSKELGEKAERARKAELGFKKAMDRLENDADARLSAKDAEATKRESNILEAAQTKNLQRDEQIGELIESIKEMERATDDRIQKVLEATRRDTADKVRSYLLDRAETAVLQPNAGDLAFMRQGLRPGTPAGEAIRFIGHFMAFPVSLSRRIYGREFTGRKGGLDSAAAFAHLVTMGWAFGVVSQTISDITKNRSPRDYTKPGANIAALLKGGSLGIYGDLFFGQASTNKYGGSALGSLLGPESEIPEAVLQSMGALMNGKPEEAGERLIRTGTQNIPFANVFWFRWITDMFIMNQVAETLSPGYMRRLEKRIKKENGQEFLVSPHNFVKRGGPL